jgi:hypothetical protein
VTSPPRDLLRVGERPGPPLYPIPAQPSRPPVPSAGRVKGPAGLRAGHPHQEQRPPGGRHRRQHPAGAIAPGRRLPLGVVALSAAAGVMVGAAAYTAGRLGHASSPWSDRAYWLGQALIVIPVAMRLLSRRSRTATETAAVVIVLAVSEYVVKICYSPIGFTFVDELEHWRSTVNLIHTGKLFTVNYILPISPRYPGLEEVTAALASVTGLPVFVCGLIIAGIAHLLFVCVLYMLFRHISRSSWIAGIAILIYASNPDLPSFDSMFVYQTLAVAFLGLALLAAGRVTARQPARDRVGWLVLGMLAIAATVVTHHATSFMLVASLGVVAVASVLVGDRRSAPWLAAFTLFSAAMAAGWVLLIAPQTVSYFRPTVTGILHGLRVLLNGGPFPVPSAAATPPGNQALAAAAVLAMSALLPAGWWQVWRRYRRQPWVVAMAIGSASWYAIIVVRLVTADGSELAGRAATFVFIPASFIAALVVARLTDTEFRAWRAPAAAVALLVLVLTLMFDGLVNGWPPYWERLPGGYQVAGFERSVGPEEIAAGRWALRSLGPGNRFAVDFGNFAVLGSYGDQDPVRNVAYLYSSPTYTASDANRTRALALHYALVDWRLTKSLPTDGRYFVVDPRAGRYTRPLPVADLAKFGRLPGVARIYDGGNIVIYDLRGEQDAP